MEEKYLAHSANDYGRVDLLSEHLSDVAQLAAEFAAAFDASGEAKIAGLLHDIGKYGTLFQRRLEGKEHGIDHWSLGAWAALMKYQQQGVDSALAIQGHHMGLQQAAKDSLSLLNPKKLEEYHPLALRLSEPDPNLLLARLSGDGLTLPTSTETGHTLGGGLQTPSAALMLDIRMLFSTLVDADFIATEAHFRPNSDGSKHYRKPGPVLEPGRDWKILSAYLQDLGKQSTAAETVNRLRADLLEACTAAACQSPGLFTLTAPTGAGNALSMLAFALKHAVRNELRRIVIVIPYLSIIEQTVREFRKVFAFFVGAHDTDEYLLEDHSLAGTKGSDIELGQIDVDAEKEAVRRTRLLAENWDAPIVVTTSVQFLESMFANRPRACRKLHRLAQSVILFDEVQTHRPDLAVPTLAALSRLAERYGSTVVFSTATQPAFGHLDAAVRKYCTRG